MFFNARKTGPMCLALLGFTAGRQAGRQNTGGFQFLKNSLQVILFGLLVLLCYYSVRNLDFSSIAFFWCVLRCIQFGCNLFISLPTIKH